MTHSTQDPSSEPLTDPSADVVDQPVSDPRSSPSNRSSRPPRSAARTRRVTPSKPYDPDIHLCRVGFMQRIVDHVVRGYPYFIQGELTLSHASHPAHPNGGLQPKASIAQHPMFRLARKFHEKFQVGMTRHQRSYARAKQPEQSTCVLLVHYDPTQHRFVWFVLATTPEAFVRERESYGDLREKQWRLSLDRYVLKRHTDSEHTNKPRWTWVLNDDALDRYRRMFVSLIKQEDLKELTRVMEALQREPGFAGVRRQLIGLKREVNRFVVRQAPFFRLPPWGRSLYLARVRSRTVRLSTWVRRPHPVIDAE